MSTKVLLKKSSVLGKVPLATDLSYGELALNYADGKLYFKDTTNTIQSFSSNVQLSINDLTDVDTTTAPSIGQVLKWNGTNWVPGNDETVGGTGTDADTLDGFDSSYFLNYNNLTNTPTLFSGDYNDLTNKPSIPTLTSQLTNDSGYLTAVGWNDVTGKPTFATVATSGSYSDLINTPSLFSGDYNDLTNKPALVKAAVQWTTNHTLADGTRYLAGDVVYDGGNIFVANFDNESISTSDTLYWTNIGVGNRLNIDGRDIPNITYAQLSGAPNVPSSTSELTNDSGYITALDLIGYATESSVTSQLANKQDTLVSGNNIKTINGQSLLGSGDIIISGGGSESDPVYVASSWYTTTNNSSNWNTAYGWGNHASAGYLKDIKTINGQSLVGIGDITISGGSSLYTNTATTTTTNPAQVVDSFALTEYRTVKYMIQATSASEVHSAEVTLMHNDVNVFATVYNVMFSGAGKLFDVGSAVNGANVDLTVTPLVAGLTIDVTRISLVTRAFTGSEFVWPTDLETQTQSEIDLETQSYPTKDLN